MRSAVLAFALAACTPEADNFPIVPVSASNVAGAVAEDDDFPVRPDAGISGDGGLGDGGIGGFDGGFGRDAGPFLDGPPADAAALLPDSF